MSDWKQRLQDAKDVLDMGLMTQSEFETLRQKIMEERGIHTTPPTQGYGKSRLCTR